MEPGTEAPRRINHNNKANQKGGGITDNICRKKPNTELRLRMRTI
jgi:hypothetical protein